MNDETIEAAILDMLTQRAPTSSICPSDVARDIAGDGGAWRSLMDPVRTVAAALAARGTVRITQGTTTIDLSRPVKGPIRIRRGPTW